ncbi:MAG: helix-turn-helix domain-containing protein, partial [bacterium]|nr:helix-turn-helix domain-containing protein [bacterium]
RHSAIKTRDSQLWFITNEGISIVDPKRIHANKNPPNAVIGEISFNRQSQPLYRSSYQFKGTVDVDIRFTAPTSLSPEKLKFKYRLENHDADHILLPPGEERVAHYPALEPGDYTFKVIAINEKGLGSPSEGTINIKISPLFHQTIIFKLLILLLFAVPLFAALYFYKRYKKLTIEKIEKESREGIKKDRSQLPPAFVRECVQKLRQRMEVEKVYRDVNISLQSLAEKISIPSYQLSQIINDTFKQNFSDYINTHRIEEAKQIFVNPKSDERKITSVALEVGFNSTTAFYTAFKKYTGMTPSRYKKDIDKKK